MDNEEIRELLRELKETSDESTAVKSRVVKIHFDTRREAEEREREKQKALEEEKRQKLREEEEERQKQEARTREAQEKTEAIVSEAKAEASAAFSPDLTQDMDRLQGEEPSEEESGETDLKLNWDPISITRSVGAALKKKAAGDSGQKEEPSSPDDSPEEGEESDEETEGLKDRVIGTFRRGMNGLLRRLARQDEEDEKEERGIRTSEEDGDEGASGVDPEEDYPFDEDLADTDTDDEAGLTSAGSSEGQTDPDVEMREIMSPEPESGSGGDDWKKLMEQPPRFNLRHVKIPDMPVRKYVLPKDKAAGDKTAAGDETAEEDISDGAAAQGAGGADRAEAPEAGAAENVSGPEAGMPESADGQNTRMDERPAAPSEDAKDLSRDDFESDEADFRSGPDRGMRDDSASEQRQPEKKLSDLLGIFLKKEKKAKEETGPAADSQTGEDFADAAGAGKTSGAGTADDNGSIAADGEAAGTGKNAADGEDAGTGKPADSVSGDADRTAEDASGHADMTAADAAGQPDRIPENGSQDIEVVNLNENANHRQVEVFRVEKNQTGPLPSLSGEGRRSRRERRAGSGETAAGGAIEALRRLPGTIAGAVRRSSGKAEGKPSVKDILSRVPEKEEKVGSPAPQRQKLLITGALIAAGIVLAVLLVIWSLSSGSSGSSGSTGSGITADDGLTVRIRQQPTSYVKEGDVTLSIRVPNTIQSITVNDTAVDFEGDKKTEISWHATDSQLKLMVVSTDKVRSASIRLAYVDSKAPTVSVSTEGRTVTLSAKDDSSGVSAIYYGTCGPFSDVPLYQKYMQPFEEDEDAVYFWYAVDNAGNSSAPASGTFTEAESISFSRESYQVYPDHPVTVNALAEPENAFVNNLTYSSSDEKVFRVEQGNMLVPVGEGSAYVTASADGLTPAQAKVIVSNAKTVTISAVGDCTLGTDPALAPDTSFNAFQIVNGDSYFFENIRGILQQDDATYANFEGTLTTSEQRQNKKFTFKGDPSYANILKDGSINVVTLANNHSGDYGDEGLSDTQQNLTDAGIDWCSGDSIACEDLNGIKCAFIGIYAVENGLESLDQVKRTVQEAKDQDAGIIVVYFHWNSELVEEPNDDMVTLGHAAVDAGASLVVGSHSHLVSGIEKYNGAYIVYGLGNFCFGGNLHPNDYDAMIFRQTFVVDGSGIADDDNIGIIPVRISSGEGYNNYQPTPVSGEAASQIMEKIDQRSARFGSEWDAYMVDGTTLETESSGADAAAEEQTEGDTAA